MLCIAFLAATNSLCSAEGEPLFCHLRCLLLLLLHSVINHNGPAQTWNKRWINPVGRACTQNRVPSCKDARSKSYFPQTSATTQLIWQRGSQQPERPFRNVRASRSGDRPVLCSSGTSCNGFRSWKFAKRSIGKSVCQWSRICASGVKLVRKSDVAGLP